MGLETGTYVADLNAANPTSTDPKSQGDDHLRLVKSVLKNTFAGFPGLIVVTGTEAQGSTVNDYVVTVAPAPAAYTAGFFVAFKATHANTGAATLKVNSLAAATLLDVDGAPLIAGDLLSGAIIVAWYDGTSFYLISANDRADRSGETYAGTHNFAGATAVTVPTRSAGDNATNAANTAFVTAAVATEATLRANADTALQSNIDAVNASKAGLNSPAFTGTPTAPTAAPGTNTTQLATTAFVIAQAFASALPGQTGNAGKMLTTDGTNAGWTNIFNNLTFNGYTEGASVANTSTAYTVDISAAGLQILTLTGNCTFTFPTATLGKSFALLLKQDATGNRTVTWPASVKWPGGVAPVITSTASKADKFVFVADGTNWFGSNAGQNY